MYVELMQLSWDIRKIDSPYYEAYSNKYNELEKKYKTRKAEYNSPEYKQFTKEFDEWDA
jgi:hypothetical protein